MTKTFEKKTTQIFSIKRLVFDAVFAALTTVFYIFFKIEGKFIPIFPSFLDINFSMIPVIICAFMIGPWDAAICVVIRCLLKWLFVGSGTGYVGELADVLIGLAACIPAGLIYHKTNFKHKGLVALASVVVGWVVMGILSNLFINIPWYTALYFKQNYYKTGVPDALVGMTSDAIKTITFGKVTITSANYMPTYILFAVIPFNLILSLGVVLITAPVHHRLKVLYDIVKIGPSRKNKEEANETYVKGLDEVANDELKENDKSNDLSDKDINE